MQNYENRKTRKRKKPEISVKMLIIILGILLIIAAFVILFSAQKGKRVNSEIDGTVETEVSTTAEKLEETEETESSKPERDLKINNISVTGLSLEEAKNKLLDTYQWDINLSYQEQVEKLKNPLPESLDKFLGEIYSQEESQWVENYDLDTDSMENSVREQVAAIASKWNRNPTNAQLTGWDKEKGEWIYSSGEKGTQINQEAAIREIMGLLAEKKFTATVAVRAEEISPALSIAEAKQKYKVIGTFSTTATSNSNRNKNISLAVDALDGLVILPGEEFSFNKTTGNRTTARGYMPAGAYRNGEFVEEPGGGVCQVSSTLYNTIIFAGIMTTERNPHSFEPSYVIPGEDAMVSYDGYSGPDLRFVNKQDTSVAIRATFKDKKLTISVVGIPILEKGTKISMRSEKTKEYDPPVPKYQEDQTLQPGQEIMVQQGVKGTTWKTWLVTSKDGKVVEEEYFHTSTYKGKPGVAKRNTSGVVIPLPTEAPVAAEGETTPAETKPAEMTPPGASPQESSPAGAAPFGGSGSALPAQPPVSGPASEIQAPNTSQSGPGFQ